MKIHRFKRCRLSKSDSFDQNFMKLGHIVKCHDVFFKFDMVYMAPCFKELLPLVYENLSVETTSAL